MLSDDRARRSICTTSHKTVQNTTTHRHATKVALRVSSRQIPETCMSRLQQIQNVASYSLLYSNPPISFAGFADAGILDIHPRCFTKCSNALYQGWRWSGAPTCRRSPIAAQIAYHMVAFRKAASKRGDIMGVGSGSAKISMLQDAKRSIGVTSASV